MLADIGRGVAYHSPLPCLEPHSSVAGGARPDPLVIRAIPAVDFCVAADSGADHAIEAGFEVDCLVGDLDSISAKGLEAVRRSGIEIREFPADKDKSDLELAFDRALEERPERVLVVGIAGGRPDHELANIMALANDRFRSIEVDGLLGSTRMSVIWSSRTLTGALGETISLIPLATAVHGVTTVGLEYPLTGETLRAGTSRGISNRYVAPEATITVERGPLLAVQPHALADRGAR